MLPAEPLDTNYSGAASRYAQNFAALQTIHSEIHVVRIDTPEAMLKAQRFEKNSPQATKTRALAASWQELESPLPIRQYNRVTRYAKSLTSPLVIEFPNSPKNAHILEQIIKGIRPSIIWADHTEAASILTLVKPKVPWVYSHHDFAYRLRKIRYGAKSIRDRWLLNVCRRAEETIVRSATNVITASSTDAKRVKDAGCRSVSVIPMAYNSTTYSLEDTTPASDLRIVHLGSLQTTANRVGLESYLRKAHDKAIKACQEGNKSRPSLWIIGESNNLKEPLSSLLRKAEAVLAGFAPDLSQVLRPFDISILPYEHDTGYRTKLPLLFSHGQIVVATRASVAGSLIDGLEEVCVLVERLEDFPTAIAQLANNPTRRQILGRSAQKFFRNHFTYEAVGSYYSALLDQVLASKPQLI